MTDEYPTFENVKSVSFSRLGGTEDAELIIKLEDGTEMYHYIDMIDPLYEQWMRVGVL